MITCTPGNPVARNQLIYLVRSDERIENGLRVLDNVYLSGDPELLKKIVAAEVKVQSLRAYAGTPGWAPASCRRKSPRAAGTCCRRTPIRYSPRIRRRCGLSFIRRIIQRSARIVPPGDRQLSAFTHYTINGRVGDVFAAWYEKNGAAADVMKTGELPDPEPASGDVRVRLHA